MGADDMEDLVAFVEQPNTVLLDREVPNLKTSIRALLLAYQERGRALERLSALTPEAANATTARDLHLTVKAIADTALNQKGKSHD